MGKLEANKQQKLTSLLNTAFNLFTTQGVTKTSIAEISQKARSEEHTSELQSL